IQRRISVRTGRMPACDRRRSMCVSCVERIVCGTCTASAVRRHAVMGIALFVACAQAGMPVRFKRARALHGPDFDASTSFRTSVTHSQHFTPRRFVRRE
ncbi:hypothetical protein, partial [Burkholderia sp. 4NA327C6]|uniref:hypothetical protein n=1 Tax=Burkholderia sp. 4NA327C6 TaxID=2502227 RepID=UPI001BB2BE1A